ncbi:ATP-binding protein [Streptomyces iconiensis]|uniref:Tetratricopeptide repeat protein n=1 Tax=Streptomyces iconiensis TaxID=1384038 RepID=A0ABT6ZV77_9ACTN|nr:tetratricopeptide repeat protein [Streptomyces iconiensis]MDJ1132979.1 tetratricopeptide repeat protein [Streptomyces iconiensis]
MRPRAVAWVTAVGAGVAVFASIAAGFSASEGQLPDTLQLSLALLASVLSGGMAWSQTRQRGWGGARGAGGDRGFLAAEVEAVPRQLPADLTDFAVGDSDPEWVVAKVAEMREAYPAVPAVVAVSGPPGVGKTTLIVHSAHRLQRDHPDGQLFVNLAGGSGAGTTRPTTSEVLGHFLRSLGVDGSQIPADPHERAALFRARIGSRRMLIVLDNAEGEAQVRPLLPGNSPCCVLISSRNRLAGLENAVFVNMGVMSPESSMDMLARIGGRQRLAADPAAARELARLCGHLPLALRIVGAKLATRPQLRPAQLVSELRECQDLLGELEAGDLGVEASFALSYAGLDEQPQRLFRLLAITGTGTFPAWVCPLLLDLPGHEGRRMLRPLVDAQLVQLLEAADDTVRPRYRMHDLVRVYARKLLAENDTAEARAAAHQRYAAGYLRLARAGAEALEPGNMRVVGGDSGLSVDYFPAAEVPGTPQLALRWFEEERRGLASIAEQALEAGLRPLVWELASALRPYCDYTSAWEDWKHTQHLAIRAAEAAGETLLAAVSRCNLAHVHRDAWSWDEADAELDRCEEVFARYGERHWQAFALLERGLVRRGRARWEEAVATLREAAALFDAFGDLRSKAVAVHYEADIFRDRGEGVQAKQRYDQCLPVFAMLEDARWIAITELDLGIGERNLGNPGKAIAHFEAALRVFETFKDRRLRAYAVHGLGDCHLELGQHRRALEELELSQEAFAVIGDRLAEGYVWHSLATAHQRAGRGVEREECLVRAEEIFRETDEAKGLAMVAYLRAVTQSAAGDMAGAEQRFATVVADFAAVGDVEWRARALLAQGHALAATGRPEEARELWEQAQAVFRSNGSERHTEVAQLLRKPEVQP